MNTNNNQDNNSRDTSYSARQVLQELAHQYQHIKGWGIDADPNNEPTYPMKRYTGDDHNRLNYERPPLQPADVEVLHSNERPNLSAVFGAANPPEGLSGAIRRYAFRFSEESLKHWFALVLADRVNVLEGIAADIKNDKAPNIFAEMGWGAKWKYNKKGVLIKAGTVAAVTLVLVGLLTASKHKKD